MRSTLPTDVPPNLWTMSAMCRYCSGKGANCTLGDRRGARDASCLPFGIKAASTPPIRPPAGGGCRGACMSLFVIVLLAGLAIVAVYGVMIYNSLVNLKHNVSKAWANIDVLLKQRHDEIPKLVEVCKQYRQFEQETLEKVIRARSLVQDAREKRDIGALGTAENMMRSSLGTLFAVAEAYPELKTNEHFLQLQA